MSIRYLHLSFPVLRRRLFAGALAAWVLASGAYADQHWEGLHGEVRQGEAVSLEQLLDWLEARYLGEVIEIEMERDDDEIEYEIKMLGPQGQVVEFEFDARTGQLMKIEGARINEMMRVR
ncbi:PepSY domain-containing protein [Vreelandella malpeensis]|uniref:PepSY domain-containing protein n=1 Tax=Vreelandella malpeensis TaxID=1172368 RepID=A0ABS8DR64_9GAMM|nr:PepSY domain-containing protein [Halomonas malpeensis]MCB8888350.1 PepSY domain-containing protein [Halomonas malpeensis]